MDFLTNYALHIIPALIAILIVVYFIIGELLLPFYDWLRSRYPEEELPSVNFTKKKKFKTVLVLFVLSTIMFLINSAYTYKNTTDRPITTNYLEQHYNELRRERTIDTREVRPNQSLTSEESREHNDQRFDWRNRDDR